MGFGGLPFSSFPFPGGFGGPGFGGGFPGGFGGGFGGGCGMGCGGYGRRLGGYEDDDDDCD